VKKFLSTTFLALLFISATAQAATDPAALPAGSELEATEVEGVVEAIDHEKRIVTIKGPEGNLLTTLVDNDVPNLNKVKKGDKVHLTFYQSLAWEVLPAKIIPEPAKKVTTTTLVGTQGKFPFKIETEKVDLYARITALDLVKETVTLEGPEGRSLTFKAKNPDNLKKVKKGDIVEINYTEAVAAEVTKK
jgi:Cu/Ag efflux protein CusF